MKVSGKAGGWLAAALAVVALAGTVSLRPGPAVAQHDGGPVILTVTGDLAHPTRGAFDPGEDPFFDYNTVAFDAGAGFDFRMLSRLDMAKVRADFPMGGTVHEFEGPTLASVLEAAGASGETVRLMALDGYAIELPLSDLLRKGAVLALRRDGKPLAIGGYGPTQVVFPRVERGDLAGMNDDNWIWSVYLIEVR